MSVNQDARLSLEWLSAVRGLSQPTFHVPCCVFFEGVLSISALERALRTIVSRHETLRTAFPDLSTRLREVDALVHDRLTSSRPWAEPLFQSRTYARVPLGLPVVAARDAELAPTSDLVRSTLYACLAKPFSYGAPPLLHSTLLTGQSRHVLLVVFHHLVADGWSVAVFIKELAASYRYAAGEVGSLRLPELTLQFGDFALRQREFLSQPAAHECIVKWQTSQQAWIPHLLTAAELAGTKASAPVDFTDVGFRELEYSAELSAEIRRYCSTARMTPFVLFLSALYALGYLRTRRSQLALWILSANRTSAGTDALIGWLSEARLAGIHVDGDSTFAELAVAVRDRTLQVLSEDELLPMAAIQWSPRRPPPTGNEGAGRRVVLHVAYRALTERVALSPVLTMWPARMPYATAAGSLRIYVEYLSTLTVGCTYLRSTMQDFAATQLLSDLRRLVSCGVLTSHQPLEKMADEVFQSTGAFNE